jgi:hypothetical protein
MYHVDVSNLSTAPIQAVDMRSWKGSGWTLLLAYSSAFLFLDAIIEWHAAHKTGRCAIKVEIYFLVPRILFLEPIRVFFIFIFILLVSLEWSARNLLHSSTCDTPQPTSFSCSIPSLARLYALGGKSDKNINMLIEAAVCSCLSFSISLVWIPHAVHTPCILRTYSVRTPNDMARDLRGSRPTHM